MEVGGISLLVALGAGLFSFLSPCLLPLVPPYLAYLTGTSTTPTTGGKHGSPTEIKARAYAPFLHSLSFTFGFSVVFVSLGVSLGIIGFFLREHQDIVQKVAGSLLIALGLHLAGVITIPFLEREQRLGIEGGTGYLRSFLVGCSFAAGWSPCIGPTLGAILALAVSGANVAQAAVLLGAYSAGLAIPFLLLGLAFNALLPLYRWLRLISPVINYVSGATLVVVGVLIFTNSLINLNSLFDWGPFSKLTPTL